MSDLGLRDDERRAYAEDGYLVRFAAFTADQLEAIAKACERVVDDLRSRSRGTGHRLEMGSYVFEIAYESRTTIKWEQHHPDTVLGIEPIAHLDPHLEALAIDPRFTGPMRDLLGCDEVALYTEKLNVKRAGTGGAIALHQDHPYWVNVSDDPSRIATAVLFLDEANLGNGCLEVAPGSHRMGVQPGREGKGFARNEIDPGSYEGPALVPLEVPAGSIVYLGPLLVHGSAPNRSHVDRRALLYSYQPAGHRHAREFIHIDPAGRIDVGAP